MAKKHKPAFTLVEVLLSLAILGMLMAAVAVAFDASVKNYQVNEGIYRAVNTGRQVLLRLTNDIRTADENGVSVEEFGDDLYLTVQHTVNSTIQTCTYRYNSSDKTLYLYKGGAEYVLLGDPDEKDYRNNSIRVSDLEFTEGLHEGKVRNIQIKMTITDENESIEHKLVAAAVVRRNLGD